MSAINNNVNDDELLFEVLSQIRKSVEKIIDFNKE